MTDHLSEQSEDTSDPTDPARPADADVPAPEQNAVADPATDAADEAPADSAPTDAAEADAAGEPAPQIGVEPESQPSGDSVSDVEDEAAAILGATTPTPRDEATEIAAVFGAGTATPADDALDAAKEGGEKGLDPDEAAGESPAADESADADTAEADSGDAALDEDELLAESARQRQDSPYDRPGKWYVIHSYAGYEKKVQSNLGSRIQSMNMEGKIFEVVIPTESVTEFKNGKRVQVQKKVFPGYLLCRCFLDDDSWYVIRNTPGVTGFVGTGGKPTPLTRKDVENFLQVPVEGEESPKRSKPRLEYDLGETVRVKEGPFADFSGEIAEINEDQLKVKVLVNIFGRETPVELEFSQVAKL